MSLQPSLWMITQVYEWSKSLWVSTQIYECPQKFMNNRTSLWVITQVYGWSKSLWVSTQVYECPQKFRNNRTSLWIHTQVYEWSKSLWVSTKVSKCPQKFKGDKTSLWVITQVYEPTGTSPVFSTEWWHFQIIWFGNRHSDHDILPYGFPFFHWLLLTIPVFPSIRITVSLNILHVWCQPIRSCMSLCVSRAKRAKLDSSFQQLDLISLSLLIVSKFNI